MLHYHCICIVYILIRLKLLLLSNRIYNDNEKKKKIQDNLLKEIKRIKENNSLSINTDSESDEEKERMNFPELEEEKTVDEKEIDVDEKTNKVEDKWDISSESTVHNNCNNKYEKNIEEYFKIEEEKKKLYPPLTEALLEFNNLERNVEMV